VPHVTPLDRDRPVLERARREDAGAGVEYLQGDFLSHGFGLEPFDVIVSVAALHHMDSAAALAARAHSIPPLA
jgi:2-polyprenyl-3-methyl-5-hydroxy-6-metoxy-1,4-benzoquinol methylase